MSALFAELSAGQPSDDDGMAGVMSDLLAGLRAEEEGSGDSVQPLPGKLQFGEGGSLQVVTPPPAADQEGAAAAVSSASSSSSSSDSSSSSSDGAEEWVDSCDYGEASYWEGYYQHHATQRGTDTEWYAPLGAFLKMVPTPAALRSLLGEGKELRTLVLGCGNSELSEHLRDAGYGHIVSVDISEVCVQQMRARHAADSRLSFEVGDVRDMRGLFADGSFALVVDKATLDAVFIATGTGSVQGENFEAVDEFLREGAKNATFCTVYTQNVAFYQDRLGTNIGKALKKRRVAAFFAGRRVLVRGGALVSLSHMDRAGFFTPRCDTKHNRTYPGRLSVPFPLL